MSQAVTWDAIVDDLRLQTRVQTSAVTRDILEKISYLRDSEPQNPETREVIMDLVSLFLFKLAIKAAFFPDPARFDTSLVDQEYRQPLKRLGLWSNPIVSDLNVTIPRDVPSDLPPRILEQLNQLKSTFAEQFLISPEPDEITLAEVADLFPSPAAERSFKREESVFGPHNAAALAREGGVLPLLYQKG